MEPSRGGGSSTGPVVWSNQGCQSVPEALLMSFPSFVSLALSLVFRAPLLASSRMGASSVRVSWYSSTPSWFDTGHSHSPHPQTNGLVLRTADSAGDIDYLRPVARFAFSVAPLLSVFHVGYLFSDSWESWHLPLCFGSKRWGMHLHHLAILTSLRSLLINHPATRYKAPSARGPSSTYYSLDHLHLAFERSSRTNDMCFWLSVLLLRFCYDFLSFFAFECSSWPGASNVDETHSARRRLYTVILY